MTPDLIKIVDQFEPYGNENDGILFMSRNLPVIQATTVGKTERTHLKLNLDCGKSKWPALFWGAGDMLHREIENGDKVTEKKILLVDDVITTGASILASIKLLEKYKPKKIVVLVILRDGNKEDYRKLFDNL